MTRVRKIFAKSDGIGFIASFLCLLHCIALPWLISLGHAYLSFFEGLGVELAEYAFLLLSAYAVHKSSLDSPFFLKWLLRTAYIAFLIGFFTSGHELGWGYYVAHVSSLILVCCHLFRMISKDGLAFFSKKYDKK